jgi:peptidoglycan hydrolase-like protein with peptidoglycan-binding domain
MSNNRKHFMTKIAMSAALATMAIASVPGVASASVGTSTSSKSAGSKTAPGQPAFGEQGAHVKAMQEAIIRNGFTLRGGANGVFDNRTVIVLKNFQKVVGLRVTGVVDAPTAKVLKLSVAPAATPVAAPAAAPKSTGSFPLTLSTLPKRGTGSNRVVIVQKALIAKGIKVPGGADGIFGSGVTRAIQSFQRTVGLSVTGTLNESTAIALGLIAPKVAPAPVQVATAVTPVAATPTAPSASVGQIPAGSLPVRGQRGENVRLVQNALINAGITVKGGADGVFGGGTAVAIAEFQKAHGLTQSGRLDYATAMKLGVTVAPTVQLDAFPMQGPCSFTNTWHAPRGGGRLHKGVDLIANEGNLLYAVADGVITKVYTEASDKLAGNGIRLTKADGTYFFYGHMQRLADGIAVGTPVKAGQVVGYNGKTGNTNTPHLHFEIHPFGGEAIDPTSAVAAINACGVTAPRN